MNDKKKELRDQIDAVDERITALLKERFNVVLALGALKKQNNLSVKDEGREQIVLEKVKNAFEDEKMQVAALNIYKQIIAQCVNLQK